jgi:hypothetical protein
MTLRHPSVFSFCLALALPVCVAAADPLPSDLLSTVLHSNRPLEISAESHVETDGTYASLWLTGRSTAGFLRGSAQLAFTLDVATAGATVRAKAQLRRIDGDLYLWIESIDGGLDDVMKTVKASLALKQWIRIPAADLPSENVVMDLSMFDDVFQVTMLEVEKHRLTLTREAMKSLLRQLQASSFAPTKVSGRAAATVTIDVRKPASGLPALYLDATLRQPGTSSTTVLWVATRSAVADVEVPRNVTNLEAFADSWVMSPLEFLSSPTSQLQDARNAQRRSDVNTILNATYQYAIDNNGRLPSDIPRGVAIEICRDNVDCGGVDLSVLTRQGMYLVRLPADPTLTSDSQGIGYTIMRDASDRITVAALYAEGEESISVTR